VGLSGGSGTLILCRSGRVSGIWMASGSREEHVARARRPGDFPELDLLFVLSRRPSSPTLLNIPAESIVLHPATPRRWGGV
jgi:hypothetical protein